MNIKKLSTIRDIAILIIGAFQVFTHIIIIRYMLTILEIDAMFSVSIIFLFLTQTNLRFYGNAMKVLEKWVENTPKKGLVK